MNRKEKINKNVVIRKDYKNLVNWIVENKNNFDSVELKKSYVDRFGLEFNNVERCIKRMLRVELRENLKFNLEKENFKFNDFVVVCERVMEEGRDRKRKGNSYLYVDMVDILE